MFVSDGSGNPPITTFALLPISVPRLGPIGRSDDFAIDVGFEKTQCLVMSVPTRAARAPSSHTDDDPRKISNSGKNPPQNTPIPMSLQRAAGSPLISTVLAPET